MVDSDDAEGDIEAGENIAKPTQAKANTSQFAAYALFTHLTNKLKLIDYTPVAAHFAFLVAVNITSDLFSLGLNYLLKKN